MSERAAKFLKKKNVDISELKYLCHSGQYTTLYMTDGSEIQTYIPLKEIAAQLPADSFWSIQKGIAVSARYVISIENGIYTMIDGKRFRGRQHNPAEHKRRSGELSLHAGEEKKSFPLTLTEKCTLMEDAPIAFCVIELVFERDGRGIDFIFRYCNKEMEAVEGVTVPEMLDRSFYSVFPNGDKKWIVPYADVALNGSRRTIRDFSPEIDKDLIIHCFQPEPGYCACFLVADEKEKGSRDPLS